MFFLPVFGAHIVCGHRSSRSARVSSRSDGQILVFLRARVEGS